MINIRPGSLTDRTCGYGPQDVGSTPAQGANRRYVKRTETRLGAGECAGGRLVISSKYVKERNFTS